MIYYSVENLKTETLDRETRNRILSLSYKKFFQDSVNNVVDNYFKSLSVNWDKEDNLIARISQLETRLLGVAGVLDITNTKMNNSTSNLSLESNEIPVRQGDVVINV